MMAVVLECSEKYKMQVYYQVFDVPHMCNMSRRYIYMYIQCIIHVQVYIRSRMYYGWIT